MHSSDIRRGLEEGRGSSWLDAALSRRSLLAGATALGSTAFLAACSGSSSSPARSASSSGISQIVVAMPDQATQLSFDAGWTLSLDFFDMELAQNETLIRKPYVESKVAGVLTQSLYKFEGVLAKSYEVSADKLTYTFHLKEGVKSQRGNLLTADDVIWSYQRKFGSPTSITPYVVAPALTDPTKQFAKVDDHTLTITVARPGDGFTLLSTMADITGQIYDSTYLKAQATADDPWATKWSTGKTNFGFGPYKVESMTEGTETVLVANPDYVMGEPAIKRIVRRVVADPGSRLTALESGDADVVLSLRAADQATLAKKSGFTASDIPANNYLQIPMVVTKAPFDDVAVRKALALAIDYHQIVTEVYKDRAVKTNVFLQTDAPGYVGTGLPDYSYKPAKAKAMLAAAGHGDGVPFTLTYSSADAIIQDVAVSIQSSAKSAGFTITLQPLPPTQFSQKIQNQEVQASLATGGAISLSPPYELLLNTTKGSSNNLSSWSNQDFYDAVDAGIAAGDALSPAAGAYWNKAEKIWLTDDAATIYIARTFPTSATGPKLTHWAWRTDGAVDYSVLKAAKK